MNRAARFAVWGVGGAVALFAGYSAYSRLYAGPRRALLAELETTRKSVAGYEDQLAGARAVRDGLKAAAADTLGDKQDTAEHRFRTTLNSIAEGCGLREIRVDNRDPVPVRNPAGQQQPRDKFGRLLRAQVDFHVIKGTVGGIGSLDQVLRAVAAISAQTWVHRVEGFSIKPVGNDRDRYELRLAVATMFIPELAPKSAPEPARVELTASAADAWRSIVEKNVFKRLTGVVESPSGDEALLVNVKTNERSTLPVGGTVLDAVFESGQGERAVFRIAEERFEVVMGSTLDQRQPVDR
jgi:hypothetical protein